MQGAELWAITCYFNPMGYRRRLANFRTFRKHLPVPLVAVELAYGRDFELQPDDAEILLRLRSTAVMWQKERLLNLALAALPAGCRKVAWLDCDVILGMPDWPEPACLLLDEHPIIQLFRTAHYLPPRWAPETARDVPAEFIRPSIAYELACGAAPAVCLGDLVDGLRGTSAAGFAWAARREILDQHGFYDACIGGGGTRAMVCAANRCFIAERRAHGPGAHARLHGDHAAVASPAAPPSGFVTARPLPLLARSPRHVSPRRPRWHHRADPQRSAHGEH